MKKYISIILISIICFSSLGLSTYSAATSDEYLTYELSSAEKVTVKDVTYIQNYVNNQVTITQNSHH